jgi:vacuolar protein sorting-associated protein 35
LECLQRALKLADACTNTNPAHLNLFVELLDHYLFFFEKGNPSITGNYITGLAALIKEHANNLGTIGGTDQTAVVDAKRHFMEIILCIKKKKADEATKEKFAGIDVPSIVS